VTGFLLSGDEFRALHRLLGSWLPGFLVPGDEADPFVDAVAVRGLAAREFVALTGDEEARLLPPLAGFACAFTDAVIAAEIVTEDAESAFSLGASGTQAVLEYLPYGLVRCTPLDPAHKPSEAVAELAGLGKVTGPAPGGEWAVGEEAYAACDELALAGDEESAVTTLIMAGVAAQTAKAWVTALSRHTAAAAVTAVRREQHSGRLEAAEVRWLLDEAGGAWRISARDNLTVLTPVGQAGLTAALGLICEGERR
jgi:hypothetical protein